MACVLPLPPPITPPRTCVCACPSACAQVVTCSGVGRAGSLRVVRNGIGLAEQAAVELPGIKGVWALRAHAGDATDKYLVLSFVGETRILAMNEEVRACCGRAVGMHGWRGLPASHPLGLWRWLVAVAELLNGTGTTLCGSRALPQSLCCSVVAAS